MAAVRPITSFAASCLALLGLMACGRAPRPDDAGSVAPGAPVEPVGSEAAASASTIDESWQLLHTAIERARQLHASVLAEGDAADVARARFELAEVYASAVVGLDVVRYDLHEQRVARPPGSHSDLDRREAELVAQQAAWLDAAAVEYAEVIRATDPAAVELRPRARYGLSDVERRRGKRAAMHDALVALVHDDPTHPLASPALLALADEAFEAGRFAEAKALYEQVLVLRGDERHYARYKLGWVALDLDDAQSALSHWVAVASEASGDPRQRALVENAVKDCVIAYARVGRPEKAKAFFTRLAPARADELVRRLAETYEQEGRSEDAARALGIATH